MANNPQPAELLTVGEMVKEIKEAVTALNIMVGQAILLDLEVTFDIEEMRHYTGNIPVIIVHIKREL